MNYKDWYSKVINKDVEKADNKKSVFDHMTWNEWLDYINDPRCDIEPEIRELEEQINIEEIPY